MAGRDQRPQIQVNRNGVLPAPNSGGLLPLPSPWASPLLASPHIAGSPFGVSPSGTQSGRIWSPTGPLLATPGTGTAATGISPSEPPRRSVVPWPESSPEPEITDELLALYCQQGKWGAVKAALSAGKGNPARISELLPLPMALPTLREFHDILEGMVESTLSAEAAAQEEVEKAAAQYDQTRTQMDPLDAEVAAKRLLMADLQKQKRQALAELQDARWKAAEKQRALANVQNMAHSGEAERLARGTMKSRLEKALTATDRELRRGESVWKRWGDLANRPAQSLTTDESLILLQAAGLGQACQAFVQAGLQGDALLEVATATDFTPGSADFLKSVGHRRRLHFFLADGLVVPLTRVPDFAAASWDSNGIQEWLTSLGLPSEVETAFKDGQIDSGATLYMLTQEDVIRHLKLSESQATAVMAGVEQLWEAVRRREEPADDPDTNDDAVAAL
eukprot:CAMPEP_0114561952 /NCGR_PEP_ID=MMETSP0114-20121206/12271_1 /TAXON_ID=31324 /ORGANISM="Goniomonas sp, Strain m" /LENGTH=449 /DNA_ID=CAMNT_0001747607 /DNA_START=8 /DNA_END=1354 /DNA_ORIENTATION=+